MNPSDDEKKFEGEIRSLYNSGDCKAAVALSIQFLKLNPNSILALHYHAVMHGDYSQTESLTESERHQYMEIAKQGIQDLFEHREFPQWPEKFRESIQNEYFCFFDKHLEQYQLGIDLLANVKKGHYSACVGASMMAFKSMRSSVKQGEEWALKSLHHFREFEKRSPDWYNINYFAAQSTACLGYYEEALTYFLEMYRKQKSAEKADEILGFQRKIKEIATLRSELGVE